MLSILLMFSSLFVWAYSIPLICLFVLFGFPIAMPLFATALFISTSLQLLYEKPIPTSKIRTYLNNLDFSNWFGKIDRVELPEKTHLITSHPHNIFCLGAFSYSPVRMGRRTGWMYSVVETKHYPCVG